MMELLKKIGMVLLMLLQMYNPYTGTFEPLAKPQPETMLVHYIDVGQADCTLIECGGEYLLIDGGNVDDSRLVVSYLEQQGVQKLEAVICTHAHEDHVGGLPAVLAKYPAEVVYAPVTEYDSKVFRDFRSYAKKQSRSITIPAPGDSFSVGDALVTVLGPVKAYEETNDTSIVVKVVYGETSFLFTGDMEITAEADLLNRGTDLKADVLKVGHHGSETSTSYRFLYEVNPTYGVISVGRGNTYGHPDELPMSRLKNAGVVVFRTDELGTVVASSDGREVQFTWANQNRQPADAEPAPRSFVGNRKTRKFHAHNCSSLPKKDNWVDFADYDAAFSAGYTPCGSCIQ